MKTSPTRNNCKSWHLKPFFIWVFAPTIALNLSSCHSSDLGSEEADRVAINLSLTGWESGAGAVIKQKCANCHTSSRSSFVPTNTPTDLDGIESLDFFRGKIGKGIARMMKKRIESDEPTRIMPPNFATPLYSDEKAVLLSFLKSVEDGALLGETSGPKIEPNCKKINMIEQNNDCSETTPPNPTGPVTGGGGEGGGGPTTPVNPPGALTFEDIRPIVKNTCAVAGCHTGSPGEKFRLTEKEDFTIRKLAVTEVIEETVMPPRRPEWAESPDGQMVMKWLTSELN
ncbi:MAG: hypothetical protein NT027_10055 [Proteobacteria bacterium]|nr:hypothetical protein [Pseudomonadota bacterium]